MADETHMPQSLNPFRKRKLGHKKGKKAKKRQKQFLGVKERVRKDPKVMKLLRKKARDYNSDDDEKEEKTNVASDEKIFSLEENDDVDDEKKDLGIEIDEFEFRENDDDDGEDGEIQPGVTKFIDGCRAFRIAFNSIMKKGVSKDSLGPVLSAHKKLLAEKLAEEEAGRKVTREAKKEKKLMEEKGHVKPANYLDSHEKDLIRFATRGVVKLFNAVNKAQNAQKGLNPSRTKDAKVLNKRRKEAFFSELSKTTVSNTAAAEVEGPSWAPLRDNYMLTNSKLKDWDKMPDPIITDGIGKMSEDSGSDDD